MLSTTEATKWWAHAQNRAADTSRYARQLVDQGRIEAALYWQGVACGQYMSARSLYATRRHIT